jgi:predicted Zn-dependent peptidase
VTAFPVEHWRLSNGLDVIVQPDRRWPLIASVMCYDAGARHDAPGRAGLAHLAEHLAFHGPRSRPALSFPERIARIGGIAQAVTRPDRITFSAVFPPSGLAEVLSVEAERMARPFDPADANAIAIEQRVLIEELRMRTSQRVPALAVEQLHRLLFAEGHPYHRPAAGVASEVEAITAADLRACASRFTPHHATLVLAGDVSPGTAATLIEGAFGSLPRGEDAQAFSVGATPANAAPANPARTNPAPASPAPVDGPGSGTSSARRSRVIAPVAGMHAYVAWAMPGFGDPGWPLASLLVRALGVGRSNPLARTLEGSVASEGAVPQSASPVRDVRGALVTMREASTMFFTASGTVDAGVEYVERRLSAALDTLLSRGLCDDDLARGRRKALSDHYFNVQSLERRADLCASLACDRQTPDALDDLPDEYEAIDRGMVDAFIALLRSSRPRATLSLVPRAEAI